MTFARPTFERATIGRPLIEFQSADALNREIIYQPRPEAYGHELGQHPIPVSGKLSDPIDGHDDYIVARENGKQTGFISITPPTAPSKTGKRTSK